MDDLAEYIAWLEKELALAKARIDQLLECVEDSRRDLLLN